MVPLCFRLVESIPLLGEMERSTCKSLSPGLMLLSRKFGEEERRAEGDGEGDNRRWTGGPPSRKMWTVSVAEDTQRRDEVALKDML